MGYPSWFLIIKKTLLFYSAFNTEIKKSSLVFFRSEQDST